MGLRSNCLDFLIDNTGYLRRYNHLDSRNLGQGRPKATRYCSTGHCLDSKRRHTGFGSGDSFVRS